MTEYKVGYKKPPLDTHFPPGQSGDPAAGRGSFRHCAATWKRSSQRKSSFVSTIRL